MKQESAVLFGDTKMTVAHYGWAAMFLSILIWTFGEVPTNTLGNTGNWYRIGLVLFAAAVTFLLFITNTQRLRHAFPGPLMLLLAYGVVAIVSSQYVPRYSFYSMWKAAEVIIDVLLMVGILSYRRQVDSVLVAYRIIMALLAALLVLWWLEAIAMPSRAFVRTVGYYIPVQLQGILPVGNPDGVGYVSAIVAYGALARLFRAHKPRQLLLPGVLLGAALVSLILAQARTGLAGFIAAALVYLLIDRRFAISAVVIAIATAAVAYTGFANVAQQYVLRGQSPQLFGSLSGRVYGWQAAWELFKESPILGHGFAAAARTQILGITGASTLHGSVFDVLVGVGTLGLIPWGLAIVWSTIRLIRLRRLRHPWFRNGVGRSLQAEMSGLLVLILIGSITGSDLAMHTHTFMLFLVTIAYAHAVKRAVTHSSTAGTAAMQPKPGRSVQPGRVGLARRPALSRTSPG
jgi:O-antigen ligase